LALKAALWFRRIRLLIMSPVPQPSWLHSGQQSTYPDIQISRATSETATRVRIAFAAACPYADLFSVLVRGFLPAGP
jgi:hypothetical protein